MIRTSKHILKYQTRTKNKQLEQLFKDFKCDLQYYIDLLWEQKLELKKFLSSKEIPTNIVQHSRYKQVIYKQASEIVRGQVELNYKRRLKRYKRCKMYFRKKQRQVKFLKTKFSELKLKTFYGTKPIIKNLSMNIDSRFFDIKVVNSKEFNEFIHLRLHTFEKNKKRATYIRLPIKYHKHSLKFKNWKRKNTIQLKEINGKKFINFVYEKENPKQKIKGKAIGIDQGYKKLIVTSENQFFGLEFEDLYKRISNKVQDSKNFKDLLKERDKKINETINKMDLEDIKQIVIEDLKGIKQGTKGIFFKTFMNKLQRWSYRKVIDKLERFCEENGVLLTKIDPAYTSQTCSKCGFIHKDNRKKKNSSV